jgi:magnesium chelatase subunit H
MTPKRTSVAERNHVKTTMNVVVVTMDSHLASATERANAALSSALPGLSLTVHAAAEWGDNPAALARCKADIAQGDIVIAAMLFLEDNATPWSARCRPPRSPS